MITVFTSACEALVSGALSGETQGQLPLHSSATSRGAGSSALSGFGVTVAGQMPSGPSLEGFFEGLGLGRVQEGRRLKQLCYAVLEVRDQVH